MLSLAFFSTRYVILYITFLEIFSKESSSDFGEMGFNSCEWTYWPMRSDKIMKEGCNESKIKTKDLFPAFKILETTAVRLLLYNYT